MGRREAEGVRVVATATSCEVSAPQVLVREGQCEKSIPTRGHTHVSPTEATVSATPQRTNPTKPPATPSSDVVAAATTTSQKEQHMHTWTRSRHTYNESANELTRSKIVILKLYTIPKRSRT
ncbi:uncharacterized protein LOC112495194 [Cephus cinctus]|uniref:Uncharacterized protein LOC112495194 n=1 Tax=Cephus cinctus TaxID=211228 RepID=A0AAJ7RSW9_CEPCN|nr:uncharacterized protein LOC112495194 [Cephus cinctus]